MWDVKSLDYQNLKPGYFRMWYYKKTTPVAAEYPR
ncbi:hypothetical protein NIES22_17300 [Calothrix brevissima NIES-22]|nr:hypothetical protein NIES22_17300 [Calothrix brevissima NIES-22]